MDSLESVQHFVDDYLGYLYELRPTAASFDGVHAFDDHVEDFTRAALDRQTRELGGFARRLSAIRPDALSLDDRLDRATLEQDVHARLLELEQVRPHERSPQFYADTLSTTLASQVVLDYAPAHERGRRLVSKLRQVSPFLNAARQNIKDPPGLFVKTALETLRGLVAFIDADMPRALWDLDDPSVLSDLADASTEATTAIGAYVTELETDTLPKAKGSFRLGRELFVEKLRLDEGVGVPLEKLIDIAERELAETQDDFRRAAGRVRDGDPAETWQALKADHPAVGQAGRRGAGAGAGPARVRRARGLRLGARARPDSHCPDAALLPLDVREHLVSGAVRNPRRARALLPDRRGIGLAGRASGAAPPRLQPTRPSARSRCTRSTRGTTSISSTSGRSPRSSARAS